MEEQRIGMMYVNLLKRWWHDAWSGLFPRGLRRSSALPLLVIGFLLIIPAIGWYLHIYGRFSRVKREIKGESQTAGPILPRPGGADPILLRRPESEGSNLPEFLSMTMVPGLGMGILQITASVPTFGEMPLLFAPSVASLANDAAGPKVGANDLHGSFEVPWSGDLNGPISPLGTSLTTTWRGRTISVPREPTERNGSGTEGGLLMVQPADSTRTSPEANPTSATGDFHNTDFDEHWPSKTDVHISAQLNARSIDITVSAKNVGDQPEPMGIGWHPRFLIPGGNRQQIELRLPMGDVLDYSDKSRINPSGKITSAPEATSRFQGHPATLGSQTLDTTLVHTKPTLMDAELGVELRDETSGFGIRVSAISPSIRAIRVASPSSSDYVSIGMQTNYDDPTGKQWSDTETPISNLLPGQTIEWKVRLEIFPIMKH